VAHQAVIESFGLKLAGHRFGHHARHVLPRGITLLDSYHVSRYNTNTGRLTEAMFHAVLADVRALIDGPAG
jgi:uracil-DNA glycosylase